MFKIVQRKEMAGGTIVLNEIEAPLIAKKAKPGQFVILKANEAGERIPLTMADSNPEKEFEETLNKAKALLKAIEMAEKGLE